MDVVNKSNLLRLDIALYLVRDYMFSDEVVFLPSYLLRIYWDIVKIFVYSQRFQIEILTTIITFT